MLRRIGNWFGAARLPGGSKLWTPDWLASAGIPPRNGLVVVEQLAVSIRCASILSDALASQPPVAYQPEDSGGRTRLGNTDASRAMWNTTFADWETMFMQLALTGNGYGHIHRNDRRGVQRIVAIPARLVTVALDGAGKVWYEIQADDQIGIAEQLLPASDVLHLKYRTLDNRHIGASPLRAAGSSVSGVVETFGLRETLFRNLSTVGLVLSTDNKLSAQQMGQLREAVDEQTRGFKAGGSLILGSGLKLQQGSADSVKANDQELMTGLDFSVREIASRVYGVPPSMVGMADESSYATSAEERRGFLVNTLQPWAARIADELSRKCLTEEDRSTGRRIGYSFETETLGYGQERAETLSKLVNSGIVSVNEARNWISLPDVSDGDVLRAPTNTWPIAAWTDSAPAQDAPEPEPPQPAPEPAQEGEGDPDGDDDDFDPVKALTEAAAALDVDVVQIAKEVDEDDDETPEEDDDDVEPDDAAAHREG